MKFLKKNIFLIFLLAGIFSAETVFSQKETRKHKWMWFRFGLKKKRDGFNPAVEHNKATHALSRKQKREDDRMLKKAKKEYKKSIKRSERKRKKG